jgi:hypothetical protein
VDDGPSAAIDAHPTLAAVAEEYADPDAVA